MFSRVRSSLNVTNDDEWAVIKPLVQKVMDARRDTEPGGFGMGPGGPPPEAGKNNDGPADNNRPRRGPPSSAERQALQKTLDDGAPLARVKSALEQYRAARKEKQAKLEEAQANLKSVITARQEAQAVLLGLLP